MTTAKKVILVMDNLSTHTPEALYAFYSAPKARAMLDRLEIHYTPKHGSWLNIAEIEFAALKRECLDRRISDRELLIKEIKVWQQSRNKRKSKVSWQFKTADARIKLRHLYPVI